MDSISTKREPLWTRSFIVLLISNLLTFLGFQMLLPTLPVYVSQHSGSSTDIGLVIGVLTIAAVIIRPFSGAVSDIFSRKKVLAAGVFICLIAMTVYFWSSTVTSILLVRIIHGIGWGISTAAFGTLAADIVPAMRRGEGIGYFGFASLLAGAIGPLLGIWLMNSYSFTAVLIFAAVSTFVSFIALLLVKAPQVKNIKAAGKLNFFSRLVEKTSLFPSALMGLLGLVYGGVVSFITLFGSEEGIKNVGWFFLIYAIGSFLVRPVSGKLFDKKGHLYVLLPGALITLLGVFILSYASSELLLCIAAIFYGSGMGAIQPSLQAWVINRAAPDRRGAANSTFFSAFDLGIGGGAMVLGSVARATNYAVMYRISGVFLVALLAVYIAYFIKMKKRQ